MNIYEKLLKIQNELKAPKGQFNKFGGYKYRSCEDILEAVKPLCQKYKVCLTLEDDIVTPGLGAKERFYIRATATLSDTEFNEEKRFSDISNTAYAREAESKKGMDESQITGTASSYARKYALNGLFCIDDTKDADTDEFVERTQGSRITKIQEDALYLKIKNNHIDNDDVIKILKEKGYNKLAEIKMKDYVDIVKKIEKLGG